MSRVTVYPPDEEGGRDLHVDGEYVGRAFSLREVGEILEAAGLQHVDELQLTRLEGIEWRGGPFRWG
ncbi:hypothetical protein [Streptomyces sp. NPDC126514]|uniref:hypothetical protein n=1 Tax=Streptomyces sp. NPDC126514 TaxID=3155210 RepID=UPI0033205663